MTEIDPDHRPRYSMKSMLDGIAKAQSHSRRQALLNAAAFAENFSFAKDMSWWAQATKKEVSAETCFQLAVALRVLANEAEIESCPICDVPFTAGDLCATDIEMGMCHAACLEGSPVVDLENGEPSDGPISTYPYEPEKPRTPVLNSDAPTAGEADREKATAEARFADWFRKNYPGPDTVIYKPDWHAPKLFRAAIAAMRAHPAPQPSGEPVQLLYRNWRDEVSLRSITPLRVWYGSTKWHPDAQWLLTAHDHDKGAERDFALKDFASQPSGPVQPLEVPSGWQPIETVPQGTSRDRLRVDIWLEPIPERQALFSNPTTEGRRLTDAWYEERPDYSGWRNSGSYNGRELNWRATHWMPRPAAPTAGGGDA
ncbi:hypothetical protein [Mesorhizobium sp. RMAD-H1]|uniref:hypothetical protein n=1 Tax=Mesorhizobium sp. RMAD-H1 TaxID=2587065 RepID=UPI0016194C05|nr:hypothetical protein [Mesorhizobium sp. RMAD-H1]MBB2973983.1 hypothetical protein [Mesorhizobium sp. RMAD-H1]